MEDNICSCCNSRFCWGCGSGGDEHKVAGDDEDGDDDTAGAQAWSGRVEKRRNANKM